MVWVREQPLMESRWPLLLMLHHIMSINYWVNSEVLASCCTVYFSMWLLSRLSILATWLSDHSWSFIGFSNSLRRLETKIYSAWLAFPLLLGRARSNRTLSSIYFNISLTERSMPLPLTRHWLSISWTALVHTRIIRRQTWLSTSRGVVLSKSLPGALPLLHL
jgi:hypothetical protein